MLSFKTCVKNSIDLPYKSNVNEKTSDLVKGMNAISNDTFDYPSFMLIYLSNNLKNYWRFNEK